MQPHFLHAMKIIALLPRLSAGPRLLHDKKITVDRVHLRGSYNLKVKTTKIRALSPWPAVDITWFSLNPSDGIEADTKTQKSWLQELWAGTFYTFIKNY